MACRLHNPWPQLQELADSIDLDAVDDVTHRHIPYGKTPEQVHHLAADDVSGSFRQGNPLRSNC